MTSKSISQLSAAATIGGGEAIPFAAGGGNGRLTPDQIADHAARRMRGRPLRLAFAGDSIAELFGQYKTASPFFWSQVRHPRRWDYVGVGDARGLVAVSGSKSGTLLNVGGAVSYAAIDGVDMHTPAMIAKLADWKPDLLVIEVGTNDSSYSPDEDSTFRNVRGFVEAVGARQTLIFPILPRAGMTSPSFRQSYNMWLLAWERQAPGIRIARVEPYLIDGAAGVSGGAAGAAGAMTIDGLHPSVSFGRAIEPMLSALLDELGAPRIAPRALSPADVRSATRPNLNLLDTRGLMGGTYDATFVHAPCAGVIPEGWQLSSGWDANPELVATASKTTLTCRGNSFDATRLVLSAPGPLPAYRPVTLTITGEVPAGDRCPGEAQAIVHVANPVGILSVRLSIAGTIDGVPGQTIAMGEAFSATDADLLPENLDEIWEMLLPGTQGFDPGTYFTLSIMIVAQPGKTPGGTVDVAQVGYHLLTPLPEAA